MCVYYVCCVCFFFFKQKTAYEMRISDWSSDVCSSDLFVLPKAAIDAEIERLASIDRPASGRRVSAVNHPMNTGPVPAYAPGIDVHIQVLKQIGRASCRERVCQYV